MSRDQDEGWRCQSDGSLYPIRRRDVISAVTGGFLVAAAGCQERSPLDDGRDRTDARSRTQASTDRHVRNGLGPDTFERLSDLEVSGGTLLANTDRHVTGTQCAELRTDGDGTWLHIPLDEPLDFSNARLSCAMSVGGTVPGRYPYVDFRDTAERRFRTRAAVRSRSELVRVDFGVLDPQVDEADVDLEAITRVSFRMAPRDEAGTETLYLDAPARVPVPETPLVVFMFDDGNETDYTEALPALSRYGYPAITYVNTDTIGDDGNLDEAQLDQLAAAGWLVGSHTADHTDLRDAEPAAIESTVRRAQQWLLERGFTEGARHFAYPYGGVDAQAISVVSQFHDTGRAGGWQPIAYPSNLQLIPGKGELTVSEVRRSLGQLVRYGGTLSLFYHGLNTDEDIEQFRGVVEEVHRRDRAGELNVVRLDELAARAQSVIGAQ
ncbi:polysaccharide deacetylase family protein [Halapricum desulfuricans]|uniref:polysaccharide deacetylase family protein n=1 Tax=Halapricum desulfuricans TaxID=2841257 RepID=UPI001E3F609E|nr:polysaccharide deacetylase family protein [Halapricum desulfuricans]